MKHHSAAGCAQNELKCRNYYPLGVIAAHCDLYKVVNCTKCVINRHAVGVLVQSEMVELASATFLFRIKLLLYEILPK